MRFFCAKCQERHDVRDISADMWSICKDGLRVSVKDRFKKLIDAPGDHQNNRADLMGLYDDILGFIAAKEPQISVGDVKHHDKRNKKFLEQHPAKHHEARINAFFALNPGNLKKQLTNPRRDGNAVTGTYTIRFSILLNLYALWNEAIYRSNIDLVPSEWFDEVMYEQELKVYFSENGVLDKVTDMENVSFPNADKNATKMMGFTHICAHCGRVLSRASGTAEEIVVALAGAPRAGKTACMISMLHSLLNGACPGIRVIPMAHDDKWSALSGEIDYYSKGMRVEKTPDKITAVPAHSIKVQLNDKYRTQRVLTIVDMPGEFWQGTSGLTPEFFKEYSGIYENLDCIWFMISKATVCLSQVSMIPDAVQDDLRNYVSEDVGIIRNSAPQNLAINLGMLKNQLQKPIPPIMVIVSKPDYSIGDLDDEKTQEYTLFPGEHMDISSCNAEDLMTALHSDSSRLYGMNQYPLWQHAANVRTFIEETCPSFLSAIEDNCANRFYAAVSPYGHPAADRDDDLNSVAPTPYHELYPFLWTMAIQGGLQTHQDVKWLKKNFLGFMVSDEHTRDLIFFRYDEDLSASKKDRKTEDRKRVTDVIRNNLLMNSPKYIPEVVINHERA